MLRGFAFLFGRAPRAVPPVSMIDRLCSGCRCARVLLAAPKCPVVSRTRVPTAADVCPRSLPPPRVPSVPAALSFVLLGVWTVFCSAAIPGLFIVRHVSLTRKKIPAALPSLGKGRCWSVGGSRVTVGTALSPPACQGCCGRASCPILPCCRAELFVELPSWRFALGIFL